MLDDFSVVIDLSGRRNLFVLTGEGQLYAVPFSCQVPQGFSTLKNRMNLQFDFDEHVISVNAQKMKRLLKNHHAILWKVFKDKP